MRPLLYLEIRQLVNAIKSTVRSPKRLIPVLLVGMWVAAWFVQSLMMISESAQSGGPALATLHGVPVEAIRTGAFVLLSVGCVIVLYGAFSSGILVFSIAHIDFLFPTPIPRRKVLLVKLIRDYLKYGMWVAFFFFFVGSPAFGSLHVSFLPWGLAGIAGITALLLTVVNLSHTINIVTTFGYERLKQVQRLVKVALILALAAAVGCCIIQYAYTGDSYASLLWAANSPLIKAIFAPADWCAGLLLAPLNQMVPEDWAHLAWLWIMAAASFVLLLSRKENVYEPSLGVSVKYARMRQAMRSGTYADFRIDAMREKGARRAGGLSLRPFGRGAVAILWKNLMVRFRFSKGQLFLMLVPPALIVYLAKQFEKDPERLHYLPGVMLYLIWILSMMAQAEFRGELKNSNIAKAMPIAAWKAILAQVVGAVIYLSVGVAVFAAAMWEFLPQARGELLLACAATAPFLAFANVSTVIIPSLLYPDTRDAAQNYICALVSFMLVSLSAVPSIVFALFMLLDLDAPLTYVVLVVSAANILIGAASISIAGLIYRKFDPTSE